MSQQIFDCPEILGESLIDLTEATTRLPIKCSRATIERWVRCGVRGVRLETVLIGHRRFTSTEAIRRFLIGQQHTVPETATSEAKKSSMSKSAIAAASKRLGLPEPLQKQKEN